MKMIKSTNLLLRFLLELCILAALGYWGFKTGRGPIVKIGLGLGAPVLAAVVWAAFVAPNSARQLPEPWLLMLELVIFGVAAAALYFTGHPVLTWAFGLLYVINKILMCVWGQ